MSKNGKKSVRASSKKAPHQKRTESAKGYMKQRRVSLNIEAASGESAYGLGILGLLFKEILQQVPPEQADKLGQAHRDGKPITMTIAESSARGAGGESAFRWTIGEDVGPMQTKGTT